MKLFIAAWLCLGLISGFVLGKYCYQSADTSNGGVMGGLPGMFQRILVTPIVFAVGVISGPIGATAFWMDWI